VIDLTGELDQKQAGQQGTEKQRLTTKVLSQPHGAVIDRDARCLDSPMNGTTNGLGHSVDTSIIYMPQPLTFWRHFFP